MHWFMNAIGLSPREHVREVIEHATDTLTSALKNADPSSEALIEGVIEAFRSERSAGDNNGSGCC